MVLPEMAAATPKAAGPPRPVPGYPVGAPAALEALGRPVVVFAEELHAARAASPSPAIARTAIARRRRACARAGALRSWSSAAADVDVRWLVMGSLAPEGVDGGHAGGTAGGVDAEGHADSYGDDDRAADGGR